MLIKRATVSRNDHFKLVEAYRQIFSDIVSLDTGRGSFEGAGSAICLDAVNTNKEALKEGLIKDDQLGSVSRISPMELGLNFEIFLQAAYELGRNGAHKERTALRSCLDYIKDISDNENVYDAEGVATPIKDIEAILR